MFTLVQAQQDGQTDVLTKPAPVPLSLAVLLSLWMFVQEQFNGTALWGREESWAGVRQLHVLHCIFSLCKAHGTLQLGKRHSSVTAAG